MTGPLDILRRYWPVGLGGCVLGAAIVLSPVTIVATLALAVIVGAAARGLTGLERTILVTVLLVAIAVRLAAIAGLFLASEPHHLNTFPVDGDGLYLKQRALWIRNIWLGVPVDPAYFQQAYGDYGWTSYIYVLAYLQYLLSPAPYAIHLFNVCCFIATAVILHRIVRQSYGPITAIVALTIILFLPTLLMWSVSSMKEPLYVLLLTTAVFGLMKAGRGRGAVERVAGLAAVVAAVTALDTIRAGALLIVSAALAIALVGTFMTRRLLMVALALIVLVPVGSRILDNPAVQSRVMARLRTSAVLHIGHLRTEGFGYKLLDQRLYTAASPEVMTWAEGQRFALRGLYSVLVVPFPWQLVSRNQVMYLPQQLIWYTLLLFAIVGAVQGCRRDVFATWLLIGMSCAGIAVMALNEGNIGTMVRHRDSVVPFVACLAAWGMVSVFSWAGLFASARARTSAGTAPQMPLNAPGFVTRAADSSWFARRIFRPARESLVCASVAAVLRPTIGYQESLRIDDPSRTDEVLTRIGESSVLFRTLRRGFAPLSRAWRHARVVAAARRVFAMEMSQRLRLLGFTFLVALCAAGFVAPLGDFAWPAAFTWAAAVACAAALALGASPLTAAWRDYGRLSSASRLAECDVTRQVRLTT